MIDFSRSYVSHWRVVQVEEDTWDDGVEVSGVYSVQISRDGTDSVPLLETGSFEIDLDVSDVFDEGWYRVILDAEQDGIYEKFPISTLLLQKSQDNINYGRQTSTISGASVLKPLEERKNIGTNYQYAPKGANGATWVESIIEDNTPAPVYITGDGFTLTNNIVFSPGVSYLEMIWNVLDAGKWCLMLDGDGIIQIVERPKVASVNFDLLNARYISPAISRSLTYEDIPNRYFAIDRKGNREVAENHSQTSRLSYENRGRWIDVVDTAPTQINGETLYSYARRKLEEASTLVQKFTYVREYIPGLVPFDLVSASLPQYGIDGELRILSQSLTCDYGIKVNETAGMEIKEWTA